MISIGEAVGRVVEQIRINGQFKTTEKENAMAKKPAAPAIKPFWDVADRASLLIVRHAGEHMMMATIYAPRKTATPLALAIDSKGAAILAKDILAGGEGRRSVKCIDAPKHRRCYFSPPSPDVAASFVAVEKLPGKAEISTRVSLGPTQVRRLLKVLQSVA